MSGAKSLSEARRLETLWAGRFGDKYNERNKEGYAGRGRFWREFLPALGVKSVLEVGCNIGGNLQWIVELVPARQVWGIDINEAALTQLRVSLPGVNALWSPARELPFRDGYLDLVFTAGVLIHQPEESLSQVMSEIVRCSRRWVLCMEYFSGNTVEVPYRGNVRALFKRDYGKKYLKGFPELKLIQQGGLGKSDGWDNVTYWLFRKGR